MKVNKVHCLFEQSGTFKNEFKKLGIEAEDYDILNDFGETDHIIDLFAEIRGGYNDEPSIFDDFTKDDLIMAFFPCIRFEDQILLGFRGEMYQFKQWGDERRLEYDLQLHDELHEFYVIVTQLALIANRRGLKLIIENPYTEQHYLTRYWALRPKLIDKDRRLRGDYYKKPTQYWFINCEPSHNFIFEAQNANSLTSWWAEHSSNRTTTKQWEDKTGIKCNRKVARSLIHPDYANRFIREFILDE